MRVASITLVLLALSIPAMAGDCPDQVQLFNRSLLPLISSILDSSAPAGVPTLEDLGYTGSTVRNVRIANPAPSSTSGTSGAYIEVIQSGGPAAQFRLDQLDLAWGSIEACEVLQRNASIESREGFPALEINFIGTDASGAIWEALLWFHQGSAGGFGVASFTYMGQTESEFQSHIRLSFTGDNFGGNPILPAGAFDQATDTYINLCLECLVGRDLWGGPGPTYFLNVRSKGHAAFGVPELTDTRVAPGCANELLFTLQPGDLVIGHVSGGCCDQNAHLHGPEWLGSVPTAYSHLQIDVYTGQTGVPPHCRTYLVPINWTSGVVATEKTSWSNLKSRF